MGCKVGPEEEVVHPPQEGQHEWLHEDIAETGSQKLFPRHHAGVEKGGGCEQRMT